MTDMTAAPDGAFSPSRPSLGGAARWGHEAGGRRAAAEAPSRLMPWAPKAPEEEAEPLSPHAALAGFNATLEPWTRTRKATLLAGGAVSLALMVGIGVWGYKLVLREVLGLPVVAAAEGPMRLAPTDPGGAVTADQGLAVNAVAADGQAGPLSDVLQLAPPTSDLVQEDLAVVQTTAEAGEVAPGEVAPVAVDAAPLGTLAVQAVAAAAPLEAPATAEEVLAYADAVAAGLPALQPLAAGPDAPVATSLAEPTAAVMAAAAVAGDAPALAPAAPAAPIAVIAAEIPGVAQALRPPARPALAGVSAVQATAAAAEAAPEATAVLTSEIAPGTNLVQLGSGFASAEIAAGEWSRLQGLFGEFLQGREPVIQEAQSNGRTFYRLRAAGFADLPDANRLCAALVAEDANCIPVVVR